MNAITLLNRIKAYSKQNPLVSSACLGSIYENLNGKLDVKYSNVNIDINSVQRSDNLVIYQVALYYSDRLLEDKSNWLEIMSASEQVLHSIINYANEALGEVEENYVITFFEQQFVDYLAGAYVTINIEVPNALGDCLIDDYVDEEETLIERLKAAIRQYEIENAELAQLLKEILYKLTGEIVEE